MKIEHTVFLLYQLPSVSLPTEREAVETRLCLCDVTVEIMNEHTKDERMRKNKEARKGSVEKVFRKHVERKCFEVKTCYYFFWLLVD